MANQWSTPPTMQIDVENSYIATLDTSRGKIVLALVPEYAPKTVNNFVFLANQGFYNGVAFHRVINNFMIQGGDPTGTGRGGPGYKFEDETRDNPLKHESKVISMANAGPNTNGSQFFITHSPQPHLDGKHTVFGKVTEGADVVDAIRQGDVINEVSIDVKLPKYGQLELSIPGDVESLSVEALNEIIAVVARVAHVKPEKVFLSNIRSGSVRVTLDLPADAARRFVQEFEQKHPELRQYSIKLERYIEEIKIAEGKHVILCLAAEPSSKVWLQLGKEHREIDDSLERSAYGQYFLLQQVWATRVRDVLSCLLRYKPSIVHFSGHGIDTGSLVFESTDGTHQPVEPKALGELFSHLRGNIRCVVLNSCYSDKQASEIAKYIDCVIGMKGELYNISALAFASAFYEAIASGESVNTAYLLGRTELKIENLEGAEQVSLISVRGVNPEEIYFLPKSLSSFC